MLLCMLLCRTYCCTHGSFYTSGKYSVVACVVAELYITLKCYTLWSVPMKDSVVDLKWRTWEDIPDSPSAFLGWVKSHKSKICGEGRGRERGYTYPPLPIHTTYPPLPMHTTYPPLPMHTMYPPLPKHTTYPPHPMHPMLGGKCISIKVVCIRIKFKQHI